MKFAGFIMTYERAELLKASIDKIFLQTVYPEKLLIIDNSLTYTTEDLIKSINNPKIIYMY